MFNKKYLNIVTRENVLNAWQQFTKGKRHKNDVSLFSMRLTLNIENLYQSLISKTYTHSPYVHFRINDPKPRDIHKATVVDRIVHHLLYSALYEYFDKIFIYDSYSCRLNKGTHKATKRLQYFYNKASKNNTKTVWVLKCDIRKFFASIDHDILKETLSKHIKDADTLNLLSNIINSFHTQNLLSLNSSIGKGLPLGNLTSQLLVNIYMNEFDQYVKHKLKVKHYIRYADDFVVLHNDKEVLFEYLKQIETFLQTNLKLMLHPNKVSFNTYVSGIDFLGFVHFSKHRVLRTTTKRRMFKKLKKNNYAPKSLASYTGMLKHGNTFKIQKKLLGQGA